ncbi:U3 snoRNP protein [Cadophora gregata]|uniref:U3 snoRNP protein n=1 Tax=Cadophora gregata TaxID=51156 RepID=UPI0026DC25AC|nr:U3 snoRNP protein [Cadophora gregata]KAK0106959.1 U3 snoRNP protein [Cadophora gregata]
MANSSSASSSMTSTSHTMTEFPAASNVSLSATKIPTMASPMANLLQALAPENRHAFIAPTSFLPDASLGFVKETLDSFAGKLGEEQAERLKEQRKKRKRGDTGKDDGEVLKIRKIYTEGFEVEQVWEQARRVIDALRGDAERALEEMGELEGDSEEEADEGVELLKFDEDGFEVGSDDESMEDGGEKDDGELDEDEELEENDLGDEEEDFEGLEGEEGFDEEEEEDEDDTPAGLYVEDPHKLNDGFFSIDEFNKQTEFLEQQDAAADPYTGEASDEEDIDWDADPSALVSKPVSSSKRAAAMDVEDDDEEEEEEDEEDGPTFGNVDLNAPEGDSDDGSENDDMDQDPVGDNTNNILYKDFFEPPPRKVGKAEMQASYLERQAKRAAQTTAPADEEAGIERAIADVRRDLFDDESDQSGSEEALSDVEAGDPKSRKSAHERRQAKIAEEIRRLEAASVAKREWTLAGEARAADRPLNSLLDEDLDFERTGKPVLEVTAEVSESIEELIKRRILAQEFDEVIRRRPETETATSSRRGLFELDDSKPQQSLAEMYEEEHVKAHNPDTYVSKSDEKLRKEEAEIEGLWKDVSAKLDALSSWHYKPKPAAPSLTVVSDVATISMEDAQPTTASGISAGQSMLAPQEIYKAGKDKATIEKGEIVPRTGAPVAREEMTREEKLRRRRREKERIKKRGGEEIGQRPESKKTKQKRETIGALKKGGVKVIGNKGEVRDVDGNKVMAGAEVNGAGGYKL